MAAGTNLVLLYQRAAAFDARQVGEDTGSVMLRKFAQVRADLPTGSAVRCIDDLSTFGPGELALAEQLGKTVHESLHGGPAPPPPGVDPNYLRQLAEYYRDEHADASTHDLAEVQANLVDAFLQLARGAKHGWMQYALAPHIVTKRKATKTDWVVGDFAVGFDFTGPAAREGLVLVRDYGNGAVLFRPRN